MSRVPINNSNYYCTVDYKANINITKKTNNMSRLFSSISERGSGLESAWSGSFPEQTWLKFGIGSRLLEALYVKSKKKHKCRFVFLRCRFALITHRQNDQCDQRQAVLYIVNYAVSEMYNSYKWNTITKTIYINI